MNDSAFRIGAVVLSQWPGLQGIGLRDFLAAFVAWTWLSVLSTRISREETT